MTEQLLAAMQAAFASHLPPIEQPTAGDLRLAEQIETEMNRKLAEAREQHEQGFAE